MALPTRRFKTLLEQLPGDSNTVRLVSEMVEDDDPLWFVHEYDEAKGDRRGGRTNLISVDALLTMVN